MAGVDAAGTELVTVEGTRGGFGDPDDVVGDSGAGEVISAFFSAAVDQRRPLLLPPPLPRILQRSSTFNIADMMTNFNPGSFPPDSLVAFLVKGNTMLNKFNKTSVFKFR